MESNFKNSMMGHLGYDSIASSGAGPGDEKKDPDSDYPQPKNYKPSTNDQRQNWNKFLDFLDKKGVGGSKDLDARDKSLGLKYLQEYNKENPTAAVNQDFVPTAQYESFLIRKKNAFPGVNSDQAKYAFGGLSDAYKNRQISPVDSWLGSSTSKQYYPTFHHGVAGSSKDYGTDFESFLGAMNTQKPGPAVKTP